MADFKITKVASHIEDSVGPLKDPDSFVLSPTFGMGFGRSCSPQSSLFPITPLVEYTRVPHPFYLGLSRAVAKYYLPSQWVKKEMGTFVDWKKNLHLIEDDSVPIVNLEKGLHLILKDDPVSPFERALLGPQSSLFESLLANELTEPR